MLDHVFLLTLYAIICIFNLVFSFKIDCVFLLMSYSIIHVWSNTFNLGINLKMKATHILNMLILTYMQRVCNYRICSYLTCIYCTCLISYFEPQHQYSLDEGVTLPVHVQHYIRTRIKNHMYIFDNHMYMFDIIFEHTWKTICICSTLYSFTHENHILTSTLYSSIHVWEWFASFDLQLGRVTDHINTC